MNALVSSNAAPRAIPRRASIILIVADGLGYGDLSCYGQTKYQTPNLDRLAAEGIRFTNYSTFGASFFANSWAQSSLMVGKNLSHSTRMPDEEIIFAEHHTIVTEILKNSGYHTGLIGEWIFGDEDSVGAKPWKKGYDEFAGYFNRFFNSKDVENFYADYMFRYFQKVIPDPTNSSPDAFIGRVPVYPNAAGKKGQYIPDLYTADAVSFIQNNQPSPANHWRPFYLQLNYPLPKTGLTVPTDAPFSNEAWPQAEKNRAALISRLDGYIGQLREELQKLNLTNNVAIFFTSSTVANKADGVDPEFFHSNISTNDLRVPMIVNWPARIPAGQVSGLKWSPQDFLPTAAAIAFASSPTNVDGISMLPLMSGEKAAPLPDVPERRNP